MAAHHSELIKRTEVLVRELPSKIVDEVLTHVTVEGAVPVTTSSIERLLANALRPITTQLAQLQHIPPVQVGAPADPPPAPASRFDTFTWGERMHPVPKDFKCPNCNVATTWALWFYGHGVHRIAPYRTFKNFGHGNEARQVIFVESEDNYEIVV